MDHPFAREEEEDIISSSSKFLRPLNWVPVSCEDDKKTSAHRAHDLRLGL
jgi:hypothetical protein